MKIQLDTTKKIIRIEEAVNLGELTDMLEKLLPHGVWKDFKIESVVINTFTNPIIIRDIYPYRPFGGWYQQPYIQYSAENTNPYTVTCGANTNNEKTYSLNQGIFNLQVN